MNKPLLPDRHPQGDLFVCNLANVSPKGDVASMGYPVFMLDSKIKLPHRVYVGNNGYKLEVWPSVTGYATVHDRDILIYVISQCVHHLNNGGRISNRIRFHAYDFLHATNRPTGGRNYEILKNSLQRLRGTTIKTNIKNGKYERTGIFGVLDEATIIRENRELLEIEVRLPDWTMDAIYNKKFLTLHPNYFRLRKATEKRIYELGRKFCGNGIYTKAGTGELVPKKIKMNLETIQELIGSTSTKKEFVRSLKSIIKTDEQHNHLPEYGIDLINRMSKVEYKGLNAIQVSIFPKQIPLAREL